MTAEIAAAVAVLGKLIDAQMTFGPHKDARVLRVQIAPGPNLLLEVGWFADSNWHECWVNEFQLRRMAAAGNPIGFVVDAPSPPKATA